MGWPGGRGLGEPSCYGWDPLDPPSLWEGIRGRVLRGAPSGERVPLRAGRGGLWARIRPTRLRPRARGDAAGRPGRRVASAGTVPAGVGSGGLGAERVRAAVEWPGGPAAGRQRGQGRAGGSRPDGGTGGAGRVRDVDAVGSGDGERLQRQAQGRLLDGRERLHRLPGRGLSLPADRPGGLGGRAQPRRRGLRNGGRDQGRRGHHADEPLAVRALESAAGIGGVGVVRRGLGRSQTP